MIKEENRNDLSSFNNTGAVITPQIIKKVYHHDTFESLEEKEKTKEILSTENQPSQKVKFTTGSGTRTVLQVEEMNKSP
jgi:hypothetical protein